MSMQKNVNKLKWSHFSIPHDKILTKVVDLIAPSNKVLHYG